jgi:hypothetical protein
VVGAALHDDVTGPQLPVDRGISYAELADRLEVTLTAEHG